MKKVLIFTSLILVTISYFLYEWISALPPVAPNYDAVDVTIANGETVFWGKGRCHVCHRIGERGYALRGPNLGESKDGPMLPFRAEQRATLLQLPSGLQYLVQSVTVPGEYIIPGYNNEMPEVYKPPIGLRPAEIKSVILYLNSLSGDSTAEEIHLPDAVLNWYQNGGEQKEIEITGDAEKGRRLFFDLDGPAACAACHIGIDADGLSQGDTTGPDLSAIGAIRTPEYLLQKIVNPDSNQVSGYERVLVKTTDGHFFLGEIIVDEQDSLFLRNAFRQKKGIAKKEIASVILQPTSIMPGNYRELLTREQLDDLVAYLITLTRDRF